MSPSLISPFRIWHQDVAKMLNVQAGLLPPLKATAKQKTIRFSLGWRWMCEKLPKVFIPPEKSRWRKSQVRSWERVLTVQGNATLCRKFGKRSCIYRSDVEAVISEESEEVSFVKVGWALKQAHTSRRRLNHKQKNYLIELFLFGEKTGRKADASEVVKNDEEI